MSGDSGKRGVGKVLEKQKMGRKQRHPPPPGKVREPQGGISDFIEGAVGEQIDK